MFSKNLIYYSCGHHFWTDYQEEPGRPDLSSSWTRDSGAVAARFYKPHPCESCGKFNRTSTGEKSSPFKYDSGSIKALDKRSNFTVVQEDSSTSSLTTVPRSSSHAEYPLLNLITSYCTLDALSRLTPEAINGSLDSILAESPTRPLADKLSSVYVSVPRSWLAISEMKGHLHTDVLREVLDILSNAQEYTHSILRHTPSNPTLKANEKELLNPTLTDSLQACRLVVDILHEEIEAYVISRIARKETTLLQSACRELWSWRSPPKLNTMIASALLKLKMMGDPLEEGRKRIVWCCVRKAPRSSTPSNRIH